MVLKEWLFVLTFLGARECCDLKPHNFQVGRDYKCKFIVINFIDGKLRDEVTYSWL